MNVDVSQCTDHALFAEAIIDHAREHHEGDIDVSVDAIRLDADGLMEALAAIYIVGGMETLNRIQVNDRATQDLIDSAVAFF